MFPFLDASACPLLPSSGFRLCQFPTFIGTMRGVRLLPFRPRCLRFLGIRYLFREMLLRSPVRCTSTASEAWSVRVGGYHSRLAGGRETGALPGLRRIFESAPRARDSGGSWQPRIAVTRMLPSARLTASASATIYAFGAESSRLAFSLSTLRPTGRPGDARLASNLPATALAGSDFHRQDSIERFHWLISDPPFPDLSWRYSLKYS
jgi:hypothetical protein